MTTETLIKYHVFYLCDSNLMKFESDFKTSRMIKPINGHVLSILSQLVSAFATDNIKIQKCINVRKKIVDMKHQ